MRLVLPALLALTATVAAAQDAFDVEGEAEICAGCHGEDGIPADPTYPVIWGQQYFYIYTQLRDYGAGRREHEIMTGIAAEYDRDQAKALAEYFAAKPWPDVPSEEPSDEDVSLANTAITGGQCSACHGKWQGDSRIPRNAGQQAAYLETTMLDFKNEVRMNAPDKISTMQKLTDEEISALAHFLSALDDPS